MPDKILILKIVSATTIVLSAVAVAEPAILYKLLNLAQAIVAAAIGISLGFAIAIKTIDHVVRTRLDPKNSFDETPGPSHVVKQQSDKGTKATNTGVRKCVQGIKKAVDAVLEGLWKSPVIQKQMLDSYRDASPHATRESILQLGQDPITSQQDGYVCVSQNVDAMLLRIFEYTYRDYVELWYAKVSCDHGVLHKLIKADFIASYRMFAERLAKVDVVDLVMTRYVKVLLGHFKEVDASDPAKKDATPFRLNPCLKDVNSELEFLRRVCDYIIKLCFPEPIASNSSSKLILREILSGLVFMPLIDTVCDPDYINLSILAIIQKKAIDEDQKTRAYMYAETYEDFIKIINEADNLNELRQIRYRIMTEIMHATTISALQKNNKRPGKARSMAKGELLITRNLKRYINQCQVAKLQCERRIKALGGEDFVSQLRRETRDDASIGMRSRIPLVSFHGIMTSPMARSYLMKYMRKFGSASLLKYWNEVEIVRTTTPTGKDLARIVSHIYQAYIRPGTADELPFEIDRTTLKGMQTCVMGNKTPEDFYKIQQDVYSIIEKDHYPSYVVSDIYTHHFLPHVNDGVHEQYLEQPDMESVARLSGSRRAPFGVRKSATDVALTRLEDIEEKLEYKAQALESLMPVAKHDVKVTRKLQQEISDLQKEKLNQQLHIERTEAWWSRLGKWNANIDKVQLLSEDGENSKVPVYTIVVLCAGVPFYEVTDDVSGWVVARNLSDFQRLHQSLKDLRPWLKKRRIPSVPILQFGQLSDKFLQNSKESLNQYLKDILEDEIVNCSELVYSFLSQTPDQSCEQLAGRKTHRRSYSEQTFEERPPATGERKSSLWQIGGFIANLPKDIFDFVLHSEDTDDSSDADDIEIDDSLSDRDSIAGPLYELIGEIFELQGLFRPLRKTLIIFVRLAFGGTINKQIRDSLQWLTSESMLVFYMQTFMDSMWPNGQLREKSASRTEEEKVQTSLEAQLKLLQNIPEAFQGLVGHENARQGTLKIFKALQDRKLNKNVFYNLLTETMEEVFPEIVRTPTADS